MDISQDVLEIGASWFDFHAHSNLNIVCADALDFLRGSQSYDFIFLDIPSATPHVEAPAAAFCTDDVVQLINGRLLPGGAVIVNVVGGLSKLSSVHRCFRNHFHSTEAVHLPDVTVYYAHTSPPLPRPALSDVQAGMSDAGRHIALMPLEDVLLSVEGHSARFSKLSMGWLDTAMLELL